MRSPSRTRPATEVFSIAPMSLREAMPRLGGDPRGQRPHVFRRRRLHDVQADPTDPGWSGGTVLKDVRSAVALVGTEAVFESLKQIGGEKGWYSGEWLWRIRGVFDQIVGGPGLRRGRRDPASSAWETPSTSGGSRPSSPSECCACMPEMRLPGEAWLTWELSPSTGAATCITQTAEFLTPGLLGRIYWLAVAPLPSFRLPRPSRRHCRRGRIGGSLDAPPWFATEF